jgi:hypothetical protein
MDTFVTEFVNPFDDSYPDNYRPNEFYNKLTIDDKFDSVDLSEDDIRLTIFEEITGLDDLLVVAKKYGTPYTLQNCSVNTKILYDLIKPLEKLKKMTGMKNVKDGIVDQIIASMQNLYDDDILFHTVITGPPGVGKTMLAKIICEIYSNMGLLKNNGDDINFKIATRSDLIGKYLGHTAIKTQEFINGCSGGIMFIDEVYALGNKEQNDSFSKECIDTINQNLTEKKNFICIVAGYPDDVEQCFFSYNSGLKRRFPFRYNVDDYTYSELAEILLNKIINTGWYHCINVDELNNFFMKNKKYFLNHGGDIDNLMLNIKIMYGRRTFGKEVIVQKMITYTDVIAGFNKYKINKTVNGGLDTNKNYGSSLDSSLDSSLSHMYL